MILFIFFVLCGAYYPPNGNHWINVQDSYPRNREIFNYSSELINSMKYGKDLNIPFRIQKGPTCGLYALGMIMDYYHGKNKTYLTTTVFPDDDYKYKPNINRNIFKVARHHGYFIQSLKEINEEGGMYIAKDLAKLATHFNYTANIYSPLKRKIIINSINNEKPLLVAFDVDENGHPGLYENSHAHWGVIGGYFIHKNNTWLIVNHAWYARKYLFLYNNLHQSNIQLSEFLRSRVIEIF